jgi:hypothetical protein
MDNAPVQQQLPSIIFWGVGRFAPHSVQCHMLQRHLPAVHGVYRTAMYGSTTW